MIAVLDPIRSAIRPEWREKIYIAIGGSAVVLGSMGYDGNTTATICQLLLAGVGLIFALLYTTSQLRAALYTAALAVQAAFALWSVGNDATWAAIISVAASVLGMGVAAAKTPTLPDADTGLIVGFAHDDFERATGELGSDWDEER